MKINLLKSLIHRNKARCGLALLTLLFSVWFALTPGAAQSKNPKRITSLHIGEASEGSRVTIVSDASLNDYEAFRRGDRFYVRIPLADFSAGQPGFRGDGFDDVQVQEVGDSVVLSFKLQPGATARVDQRSNRLDVIFSAPNRMSPRNRTSAPSNRVYVPADGIVRVNNSQTQQQRERDAGGPMPPGSPGWPQATRSRVVAERVRDSQTSRNQVSSNSSQETSSRGSSRRPTATSGSSRPEASTNNTRSQAQPSAIRSETPMSATKSETPSSLPKSGPSSTVSRYEPSPTPTSTSSPSYPVLATTTPPRPVASPSVAKSPGSNGSLNWKGRGDAALQWVRANRQAALLGSLLAVALLVFLVLLLRRRKNLGNKKRLATPLAQPKSSTKIAASSPSAYASPTSAASKIAPRGVVNESAGSSSTSEPVPVAAANAQQTSGVKEEAERYQSIPAPTMARSAAVSTTPNQAVVPASSSIDPSAGGDQEREVFEL